jgi:hypothetical protein
MAEDILTPYFKNFFVPEYLSDFRHTLRSVKILYFARPDENPREITLNPYPFMTLYDLKIMLYQHFRKEVSAHPAFQSLLVPLPELETNNNARRNLFGEETKGPASDYMTFEYSWMKAETTEAYTVINPFRRITGGPVDSHFVTETGRKNNKFTLRSRLLLEDFMKELGEERTLTLHLFLYKDVIPGLAADLRTSEREWFGRIAPYFPELNINQAPTTLPPELMRRSTLFDTYVTNVLQQVSALEELLQSESLPLLPMVVAGCKFLRLVWKRPSETIPLETLFYKLDATHERPFLRILPVGESPITKLKMDSSFKIPDVSDPRLLRIWKEERNPKPDKDFLFSKVIIRQTVGTQPALYGTLRVFDNNSADFLVLPPKQLRILDPRSDLSALGSLLTKGLEGLPFSDQTPEIASATIICAVRLPLKAKMLTPEGLRKRLANFQCFFQEISPLPGDKPLLMLRYKAVSNFAAEDKIYTFLSLMVSRSIAKGEAAMPELVVAIQKEFQLTDEEAQRKVVYWLRNRADIQLALPETKDYIMTYNEGIDIAIFGQQSYYTIHLYRIDSEQVFRRVITAVGLLLSAKDSDFTLDASAVASMSRVANAVVVASPGSQVEETEAEAEAGVVVKEAPANANVLNLGSEVSEESADMGNDRYMRLMMGGPGSQGEASNQGEGEVLNMGDVLEEERQSQASNLNVARRAANNSRAMNAAAASALAVRPPEQAKPVVEERGVVEEEEEEAPTGAKQKSYQGWVKSQLQTADQRLFQYSTDVAGRKIKKYVTMCQATESRQPYVLNQEQYEVMRETYAGDPGVIFVTYPLEAGDPLPEAGDEVYTLLKYGTNPLKQNYYLCCQFFCTKDYIMVREEDFYSPTDRQGKPKPGETAKGKKDNGSCPFCHGMEIKVLKSPKPKETVIQRRTKKGETQRHLYVSFLQGETQHPEEFYMPCCFKEDTPLYITDPRFEKVRSEEEVKEEEEVRTVTGVPTISYQVTIYRAHKKYIVGPEKEFLKISEIDGPQVGLLPSVVDSYFGQKPSDYVSREANKMELLPNANCFLRVGVENRSSYRHDSFFAALAPYLNFRNNAASVKARLQEVFEQSGFGPRIFTFLNYGNLVLEFYRPGDPSPKESELSAWVSTQLGVDYNATNKDAALRIWKSYNRFLAFLESDKSAFEVDFTPQERIKQYRQFAQMLALPGIIAPRGLILIVLEVNSKNELSIRCPPFGYNMEQYSLSDFAFILHKPSGIWEPIFFSSNRAQTAKFAARHQAEITFQRSLEAGWPPIVRQRVIEFTQKCRGIGRGAYTATRGIDPMALIPLSVAIQSMPHIKPTGVVRDAYNHIVAITYRAKAGKRGLVTLPVIDDEYIPISTPIHLDWDDYEAAPLDWIVQFYKQNFEQMFALYPGYRVKRKVKCTATDSYVGIQLANGLYIPAAAPKDESAVAGLKLTDVEEMDWSMNREIYFGNPEGPCRTEKEIKTIQEKLPKEEAFLRAKQSDLDEIYQHLRLTFANWFSSEDVSDDLRLTIQTILDTNEIPLYEKRKRLEVILGPTVRDWMDSTTSVSQQPSSLLRADCRLEARAPCPARCVWRQASSESVGRCYLHSPKEISLGGRMVDGRLLLMRRLFEELLRFPERKYQLLTGSVTTLVALKDAVKIGQQYVLPESSLAWQDILRLDWIESGKETKKYYEEMSRSENEEALARSERKTEEEDEPNSMEPSLVAHRLPDILLELVGRDDPKSKKLSLLEAKVDATVPPLNPYLVPFGTSAAELGMEEESTTLDKNAVKRLALYTRRPILYIDLVMDPPEVMAYAPSRKLKTAIPYILVSTEDGPRVLSSSPMMMQDVKPEALPSGLFQLYDDRIVISE